MLFKMDFRDQIYFIHLMVISLAKVIIGQNVEVGTADFQTGEPAQIDCSFNDAAVTALFWKYSTPNVTEVPIDKIMIEYFGVDDINIPDPKYQGRIQLTANYSLVIDEVIETDLGLRYWCQVNLGGFPGADSTNVTKIEPVKPGEIPDNCEPTSKCKTGNSIDCTVSCFNPSDDFNLKWTVDGEARSGTITEVTPSDSGNCFDGISTYTIGENDEIGTKLKTFSCEPEGRAYQYATPGEYSLSKDIEIVGGGPAPLGNGPIAGIVICVIVVIVVIGGLVYYFVFYKKDK